MSLRINLGSGQRPFQHWVNVDVQDRWHPDVVADGRDMPMFDDGTAEYICLHHVLEHFGCGEADGLLHECYRILQPGGSLLVFLPDLRALAQRWLLRQMDDQLYLTNLYGAYMGDEEDRHKWGYTTESLWSTLRTCGDWRHFCEFNYRSIDGLDAARDWWIAAHEAIKT